MPDQVEATLHWQDRDGRPHALALNRPELLLGRSSECDLVVPALSVSREHAKIIVADDMLLLVDLGTQFGTFVNGERVKACALRNGDCITLGVDREPTVLKLEAVSDPDGSVHDRVEHDSGASRSLFAGLSSEGLFGVLHNELGKSRGQRMLLQHELMLAASIQQALLPKELPNSHGFRMRAYSRPTALCGRRLLRIHVEG